MDTRKHDVPHYLCMVSTFVYANREVWFAVGHGQNLSMPHHSDKYMWHCMDRRTDKSYEAENFFVSPRRRTLLLK